MKLKSAYAILLVLLMLLGILSTLQVGIVNSSPSEVALIEVSATSPHVANGTDNSEVTIGATDALGNPVAGANIVLYVNIEGDLYSTINATDVGSGIYMAYVNSTLAGNATFIAQDQSTSICGNATVLFKPGPTYDIRIEATEPRKSESKNSSEIAAWAVDQYENPIPFPDANINIISDLGIVGPIVDNGYGVFGTNVTSNDLGIANVTAIDLVTGKNKTIQVIFSPVFLTSTEAAYILGDTIVVSLNMYVPDPSRALGFYDLIVCFNNSICRFINITDGDPNDEFPTPNLEIINASALRIYQENNVSLTSPIGAVNLANFTFEVIWTGTLELSVTPAPSCICDTLKRIYLEIVEALQHQYEFLKRLFGIPLKNPHWKKVCLSLHRVAGSGWTWPMIRDRLKYLYLVLRKNFPACLDLKLVLCACNCTQKLIDSPKDLDKMTEPGSFLHEITDSRFAWIDNETEDRELIRSVAVKPGCINVFFIWRFWDGSNGCAYLCTGSIKIARESWDGRAWGPTPLRTLAHEVAHMITNQGDTNLQPSRILAQSWAVRRRYAIRIGPFIIDEDLALLRCGERYTAGDIHEVCHSRHLKIDDNKVTVKDKPRSVCRRCVVTIASEVENAGNHSSTFDTILYVNSTLIQTVPTTLNPGETRIIIFSWNTTNFDPGSYVVKVSIPLDPAEYNRTDNEVSWILMLFEGVMPAGIHLHAEAGLIDLRNPKCTYWHELLPKFCRRYHLTSWVDNCDDILSRCDYVDLTDEYGTVAWYHVENVTKTMKVTRKPYLTFSMYIEFEGSFDQYHWVDKHPVCTQWKEVYPYYCNSYHIEQWYDNGDGELSPSDQIVLRNKRTGEIAEYHVDEVATDIIVTPRTPPCPPVASFTEYPKEPCIHQPVCFDASPSLAGYDGDDECPITEYQWDFGDGTFGSGKTVTHIYENPGDYMVTLTVYAPGIPPYIDPQYVGTNTTDTIQHVKHVLPVGGYSFPINKHTTTTPLATYLTLIAIIATTFTVIRRRQKAEKHKS